MQCEIECWVLNLPYVSKEALVFGLFVYFDVAMLQISKTSNGSMNLCKLHVVGCWSVCLLVCAIDVAMLQIWVIKFKYITCVGC